MVRGGRDQKTDLVSKSRADNLGWSWAAEERSKNKSCNNRF